MSFCAAHEPLKLVVHANRASFAQLAHVAKRPHTYQLQHPIVELKLARVQSLLPHTNFWQPSASVLNVQLSLTQVITPAFVT